MWWPRSLDLPPGRILGNEQKRPLPDLPKHHQMSVGPGSLGISVRLLRTGPCLSCVTFSQLSHRLAPHLSPQPGEVTWSPAWAGVGELQPIGTQ